MTKPDDFRGAEMSRCGTCKYFHPGDGNMADDRRCQKAIRPVSIAQRDVAMPAWCPGWEPYFTRTPDPIHEPAHYQARDGSGIECVDANRAMLTPDEFRGWLRGTLNKYLWRYRDKGGEEDLRKATQYLNWLKEHEERNR